MSLITLSRRGGLSAPEGVKRNKALDLLEQSVTRLMNSSEYKTNFIVLILC